MIGGGRMRLGGYLRKNLTGTADESDQERLPRRTAQTESKRLS